MYFNTSHVTVYQVKAINSMTEEEHFNTSHVTVYLNHFTRNASAIIISIHPMLRFIIRSRSSFFISLIISIHPMLRFILKGQLQSFNELNDFNTSHVTVYQRPNCTGAKRRRISIHPMLRFICDVNVKSGMPM